MKEGKECDWFWRRYNLPGGCYIVNIMTVLSLSLSTVFFSGCQWIQKFFRKPKLTYKKGFESYKSPFRDSPPERTSVKTSVRSMLYHYLNRYIIIIIVVVI